MHWYDVCSTISPNQIKEAIEKINNDSNGSSILKIKYTNINDLLLHYDERLHSIIKQNTDGNAEYLPYTDVINLLKLVDSTYGDFNKSCKSLLEMAPLTTESSCSQGWRALVYDLCNGSLSYWIENWMYTSILCLVALSKKVSTDDSFYKDLISGFSTPMVDSALAYYRATGVLPLGAFNTTNVIMKIDEEPKDDDEFEGNDYTEKGSQYESETYRYTKSICDSIPKSRDFVVKFFGACQTLVRTQIYDYITPSIKNAINRVITKELDLFVSIWDHTCLPSLDSRLTTATATLDAFISPVQPRTYMPQDITCKYARSVLYKRFVEMRVAELFEIIVEYPDSESAILDLKLCVSYLNNMNYIATSLKDAIQNRLLHPGATTNDVLMQYISAIRCLRFLDPTSTVLEIVARPIRSYLRSRDDTIQCIVQDMVSNESELFEDLANGQGEVIENEEMNCFGLDENFDDPNWEPLPIEAKSVYLTSNRRDADVLSLLVSIYHTKDVFVKEFEKHISQKLLNCTNYHIEREIRQVEMMKLRFGKHSLEKSEVMLKDMADSKRIDQYMSENGQISRGNIPFHATVISRKFWAAPENEAFSIPEEMSELQKRYSEVYESLKAARKLEWRNSQGIVDITVELEDRKIDISVKPSYAAALYTFKSNPVQTLAEIAQTLKCEEDFAASRIRFWVARGVICENRKNAFEVIESRSNIKTKSDLREGGPSVSLLSSDTTRDIGSSEEVKQYEVNENDSADDDDGDDIQGKSSSPSGANAEELKMYINYIVGMLTNFGSLPLDRIQSMLGMFVPGSNIGADELKLLLSTMIREDRIEMSGGMYKLK